MGILGSNCFGADHSSGDTSFFREYKNQNNGKRQGIFFKYTSKPARAIRWKENTQLEGSWY